MPPSIADVGRHESIAICPIRIYDIRMKLARFLTDAYLRGGTEIPPELDPLPLIITRIAMNRYSVESQALLRSCLAVVAAEGEMDESDIWALGNDARGLLNAFAMRRLNAKYGKDELDLLSASLEKMRQQRDA